VTLKHTRQRVVDAIGPAAAHALQDGATVGALLGLSLTFPAAVALLAAGLGINGVRPGRIIAQADKLVREEDIRPNREYFVGGFLAGALLGVAVGLVLSTAATWANITVPTLA